MTTETPIDLDRCRRGMTQLAIAGRPRPAEIEEAIRRILTEPTTALLTEYIGVKNYASFGDQREDHPYGYGPKHGTIVFSIGRAHPDRKTALDGDAIYLLEAYRDFPGVKLPDPTRPATGHTRDSYLCTVIREYDRLKADLARTELALANVRVLAHDMGVPL